MDEFKELGDVLYDELVTTITILVMGTLAVLRKKIIKWIGDTAKQAFERFYMRREFDNQYAVTIEEGVKSTMQKLRLRIKASTVMIYSIRRNGEDTLLPRLVEPSEYQEHFEDLGGVVMTDYRAFYDELKESKSIIINDLEHYKGTHEKFVSWVRSHGSTSICSICVSLPNDPQVLVCDFDRKDGEEITSEMAEMAKSMILRHRSPLRALYKD